MVTVARAEESNGRGKYRNAKKGNSNLVIVTLCMYVKLHVCTGMMYVHVVWARISRGERRKGRKKCSMYY